MQNNFQGRGRAKNVSFRGETYDESYYENPQRNSRRGRGVNQRIETEETRMVKLLPDANMTISVPNDYMNSRNYRGRGNRGILKSNSFRDDSNFNYDYDYDRSTNYSNRGFDAASARGRGRARGFYHAHDMQDYDYNYADNYQRNAAGRPLSGGYEYNSQSRPYMRDRPSSESYEQAHDNHQDQNYSQRNNRPRQGSGNFEGQSESAKDQAERSFRGRSKSAGDWSRRGRGGRGRGRGRPVKNNDEPDAPNCGDEDKRRAEDDAAGNKNESNEWPACDSECPPEQDPLKGDSDLANGDKEGERDCNGQSSDVVEGAGESS